MKTQAFVSFICGVVFALGLAISGMTQPHKIVGFLNVFGDWDSSLVFVLASAVGVYYVMFQLITKRKTPLIAKKFLVPTRTDLDLRLISGGVIFGIGWGISGLCPGPILTTLGTATPSVIVLMVFLVIGLALSYLFSKSTSGK